MISFDMVVLSDESRGMNQPQHLGTRWGPLLSLRLVTIANITRIDDMYPLVI